MSVVENIKMQHFLWTFVRIYSSMLITDAAGERVLVKLILENYSEDRDPCHLQGAFPWLLRDASDVVCISCGNCPLMASRKKKNSPDQEMAASCCFQHSVQFTKLGVELKTLHFTSSKYILAYRIQVSVS